MYKLFKEFVNTFLPKKLSESQGVADKKNEKCNVELFQFENHFVQ